MIKLKVLAVLKKIRKEVIKFLILHLEQEELKNLFLIGNLK